MNIDEQNDPEFRMLSEMLSMIDREHEKRRKPIIDRLIEIELMRTPRFTLSYEEATKAGLLP